MTSTTTPTTGFRHLALALAIPLFLCVGMALAYLGGFGDPTPHHVKVELASRKTESVQPLATALRTRLGARFDISATTPSRAGSDVAKARAVAAYLPGREPQLLVNSAASPTEAQVAVQLFTTVAATTARAPLAVHDLAALPANDPLGQNAFFLLVALTIGGYTAAIAIGAAGAHLRPLARAGLGVLLGGALAMIAAIITEPLYGSLHGHFLEITAVAWLYLIGVVLIGIGLHSFFGRFTTGILVALFVMLNFTTSAGVSAPTLQAPFFSALSHVWTGNGFVTAVRGMLYGSGAGTTAGIERIGLWAIAGILLIALAAWRESRHLKPIVLPARAPEQDELEGIVAA
jgi:hypothetical protein